MVDRSNKYCICLFINDQILIYQRRSAFFYKESDGFGLTDFLLIDLELVIEVLLVEFGGIEINIGLELETINIRNIKERNSFFVKLEATLGELTEWLVTFPLQLTNSPPISSFSSLLQSFKQIR